jgi:hypothetical protein
VIFNQFAQFLQQALLPVGLVEQRLLSILLRSQLHAAGPLVMTGFIELLG